MVVEDVNRVMKFPVAFDFHGEKYFHGQKDNFTDISPAPVY